MRAQRRVRSRGFTLIELLIVVAIIAVLATLVLSGLMSAKRRTMIARAKNEISQLKAALSMYDNETGHFPRRNPTGLTADDLETTNDIQWAYAALKNKPTLSAGGGQGSPYLDWKPEYLGLIHTTKGLGTTWATFDAPNMPFVAGNIDPTTYDSLNDLATQITMTPDKDPALCFCDPWGSPYFYREWASIPEALKAPAVTTAVSRSSNIDGTATVNTDDRPHDPTRFDIWSFGPNMVNSWGDDDDVASWSEVKKKP